MRIPKDCHPAQIATQRPLVSLLDGQGTLMPSACCSPPWADLAQAWPY